MGNSAYDLTLTTDLDKPAMRPHRLNPTCVRTGSTGPEEYWRKANGAMVNSHHDQDGALRAGDEKENSLKTHDPDPCKTLGRVLTGMVQDEAGYGQ